MLALRSIAIASRAGVRTMATGTVKWFAASKGFGFITPDDGANPDVFVHHSAVQVPANQFRMLEEGEKVKFDFQQTDRGLQAINVTNLDGSPIDRPGRDNRSSGPREGGDRPRRSFSGPRRPRNEGGSGEGSTH